MAIGERIRFFRTMRQMTQKYLGQVLGFPEKSADVRLAQYETGSRTPKADLTEQLAKILDVSPKALSVPDIDSYDGLMHTLFALEDNYGLHIDEINGEICLRLDRHSKEYPYMYELFASWNEQYQKQKSNEELKDQYDDWRYHYPAKDTSQIRAHIPAVLNEINLEDLK